MKKVFDGTVYLGHAHFEELFDLSDVEIIGSFNCRDN